MIVGVPKETAAGERRVALVPDLVPKLTKAGLEVLVEPGAGAAAGFPDAAYAEKGARLEPDALGPGRRRPQGPAADRRRRSRRLKEGATLIGLLQPYANADGHPGPGRAQGHGLRHGADAAHHARPADGRAQRHEHGRGLQGGADRGRAPAEVLPAAHDRGRHADARARLRHRRRRGRAAGHRHRAAARRRRRGLRHAARPSRSRSRAWARSSSSWPWRPRTPRTRAATPRPSPRSSTSRQRELMAQVRGRRRRGHHHRAGPGPAGPDPHHRGDGAGHAARLGDRRPRRRAGRQLRAHRAGPGGGRSTASSIIGPAQPAQHDALPRQPDVRPRRSRASCATCSRTARSTSTWTTS